MKILKRLPLIAACLCTFAVCMFTSCKSEYSNRMDTELLQAYIDEKLEVLSQPADSLGRTVVFVRETTDNGSEWGDVLNNEEIIIPIVGITVPFAALVAIVFIVAWFRRKNVLTKAHVMEIAIAKGVTVPESFFVNYNVKRTRLQSSLVWIAFGIGITGFFLIIEAYNISMLGVIVLLVGVAKLITYLIEDRKKTTSEDTDYNAEQI